MLGFLAVEFAMKAIFPAYRENGKKFSIHQFLLQKDVNLVLQ